MNTIEITSKNYVILMSGLTNRKEKVQQLMDIFHKPEDSATVEAYKQELKNIEVIEEDIRRAFMSL